MTTPVRMEYIKHLMQEAETHSRRRSADAASFGAEDVRKAENIFQFWGGYADALHDVLAALDGNASALGISAASTPTGKREIL